jgi:hypothetical protein
MVFQRLTIFVASASLRHAATDRTDETRGRVGVTVTVTAGRLIVTVAVTSTVSTTAGHSLLALPRSPREVAEVDDARKSDAMIPVAHIVADREEVG